MIPDMRTFIKIIEGRDAFLYHSTDLHSATKIIKSGLLRASARRIGTHAVRAVSTSRDPHLRFGLEDGTGAEIQFVLNQSEINRIFKIVPFSWSGMEALHRNVVHDIMHRRKESEEMIYGDIPVTSRFVEKIIIEPNANNESLVRVIISKADALGIAIEDRRPIVENVSDPRRTYRMGYCDAMALALHEMTGLPLGMWAGFFQDDFLDNEEGTEFAHACVVMSFNPPIWIDVDGIHHGVPDNLIFNQQINRVELVPASKNDVATSFTTDDDDLMHGVERASNFIISDPKLSVIVGKYNMGISDPR